MSEKNFSRWLMSKLPGDVQRIETTIGRGTPDITWCHEGLEVWIETKVGLKNHIRLRPEQYAWGRRRAAAGGIVLVIAETPERNIFVYRHPLEVRQCSKYMLITSDPDLVIERADRVMVWPLLKEAIY